MKNIILIDDNSAVSQKLSESLKEKYVITNVSKYEDCYELIENKGIKMIIVIEKIDKMSLFQFFKKVKEINPNIVKLFISDEFNENLAFEILHRNLAMVYRKNNLEEEINNKKNLKDFHEFLNNIFEVEDRLDNENLHALINNIDNLPTLKESYQTIIRMINEDADVIQISNKIESDISVCSKILQVANSAFYSAKTSSIKQAISFIGLENTKRLVLSTSIIDVMSENGKIGDEIDNIWRQSFLSNKILAFLYQKLYSKKIPDCCQTGGLLQNIGKVFFIKCFKNDYLNLLKAKQFKLKSLVELEKEKFNISHNEIGAYLLKLWDFPLPIIEACLYHHTPTEDCIINKEFVNLVYLSNYYSKEILGFNNNLDLDERVFETLNTNKEFVTSKLKEYKN